MMFDAISNELGLPFPVRTRKGHSRVYAGLFVGFPDKAHLIKPNPKWLVKDLRQDVKIMDAVIAALIAEMPIINLGKAIELYGEESLEEFLKREEWHNPHYPALLPELLAQGYKTAITNQVDEKTQIHDATLLEHFRHQRRLLQTTKLNPGKHLIDSAFKNLPPDLKSKTHTYSLRSYFSHRSPLSYESRLCRRGKITSKKLSKALDQSFDFLKEEAKDTSSIKEANKKLSQSSSFHATSFLAQEARFYPCAIGLPHEIGKVEILKIIHTVSFFRRPEHTIIAAVLSGFCHPNDIPSLKISHFQNKYYFFTHEVTSPQKKSIESKLVRKNSSHSMRPVIRDVAVELGKLLKSGDIHQHIKNAEEWLKTNFPGVTFSKIINALVHHGEAWFGLPFVFTHTNFFPQPPSDKVPPARSYTHISKTFWLKLEAYLRLFYSKFHISKDPKIKWVGCGSALTPTTPGMQKFIEEWKKLLNAEVPDGYMDAILQWNGIVAGCHAIFLALTGIRNYPFEPPPTDALRDYWEIIYQKKAVVIILPPELEAVLKTVNKLWQRYKEVFLQAGVILDEKFENHAFGYAGIIATSPKEDAKKKVVFREPCHHQFIMGCAGNSTLSRFVDYYPTFIRHFTSTLLREKGIDEHAVAAYHGHSLEILNPLKRHRLETPTFRKTRYKLAKIIAEELGL